VVAALAPAAVIFRTKAASSEVLAKVIEKLQQLPTKFAATQTFILSSLLYYLLKTQKFGNTG
jgi:hypothetical protein